MVRTIKFWGSEDDERLMHTEMDDAVESILEGMEEDVNNLPETIEVFGFASRKPNVKQWAEDVLHKLIESLDEEFGDPDDGYTATTDGMKEAADTFVTAVLKEYTVWACEFVKRETVNVQEWIKENRPDWLIEALKGKL